jgi:hypothetical protein
MEGLLTGALSVCWQSAASKGHIPGVSTRHDVTPDNSALATALAGRYAIERELGRGGMASPYRAGCTVAWVTRRLGLRWSRRPVPGNRLLPARGSTVLQPGDHVYVLAGPEDRPVVQLMFGRPEEG